MEVTDRLHNTHIAKHIEENLKQGAQAGVKSFDDEFINFLNVSKDQIFHDANIFITNFQNIRNDLLSLVVSKIW